MKSHAIFFHVLMQLAIAMPAFATGFTSENFASRPDFAVHILKGKTYFHNVCGRCAPKLYFKEFAAEQPIELQCGCSDRCSITGAWRQPEISVITVRDYGVSRPVLVELKNVGQNLNLNFPVCN